MSFSKSFVLSVVVAMLCSFPIQPVMAQSDSEEVKPLKEGEQAVDFELQSIGKKIKLSDNFGEDGKPVVVVFSRANW